MKEKLADYHKLQHRLTQVQEQLALRDLKVQEHEESIKILTHHNEKLKDQAATSKELCLMNNEEKDQRMYAVQVINKIHEESILMLNRK